MAVDKETLSLVKEIIELLNVLPGSTVFEILLFGSIIFIVFKYKEKNEKKDDDKAAVVNNNNINNTSNPNMGNNSIHLTTPTIDSGVYQDMISIGKEIAVAEGQKAALIVHLQGNLETAITSLDNVKATIQQYEYTNQLEMKNISKVNDIHERNKHLTEVQTNADRLIITVRAGIEHLRISFIQMKKSLNNTSSTIKDMDNINKGK